ncbi:MAG TPA: hypothetical protein VFB88_05615 [Xanthobacteraceae bacterium]|nr:hypothetical protein [Xanthobacteraceae bacterium]
MAYKPPKYSQDAENPAYTPPTGPVAPNPNDPNAPPPPTPPPPPPDPNAVISPQPVFTPTAPPPPPPAPLYQDTYAKPTPPAPPSPTDPYQASQPWLDDYQKRLRAYEAQLAYWNSLPATAPPPGGTTPPTPPGTTTTTTPWGGLSTAGTYNAATDQGTWDTGGYARPAFTPTRYASTAVSGYDPAKWGSATHQTPKYVVGRILSGYNLNDPAQLQAAMNDIIKAYPGSTWGGRDVITIPGIGPVDVIRDFGGQSGIAWQPQDGAAPQPPSSLTTTKPLTGAFDPSMSHIQGAGQPTSPDPFASMGGGVWANGGWLPKAMAEQYGITDQRGTGTDTTTSTTTQNAGTPFDTELDDARRQALLDLLGKGPPTAAELQASPENQAYQLQSQRAAERERAELAERAGYEGFANTGFMDTELGGINQRRAEGEAGFMGQLAIQRMTAQREDLQFAIAQAQQSGQFQLAQQLDRERMNLDAAIAREQMASSEKMAANDLALREFLGRAGIDLDRLRLGEDQRQFNYNLGYNYANLNEQGRQFDLQPFS